jgi:hypothetical protein
MTRCIGRVEFAGVDRQRVRIDAGNSTGILSAKSFKPQRRQLISYNEYGK